MDFAVENGRGYWATDGKLSSIEPEEPHETGDEAFIRLIRGEGPNWAPPEDVWPIVRFTRAALRSAETGASVAVPTDVKR
jgi:predicted dehydrogenase